MSHLDILIPFGLPPTELAPDLLQQLDAPSLATLVSRTRSEPAAARHQTFEDFSRALPHETWLARQFGLADDLKRSGSPPVAAALMQALGLQADSGTWFMLQPVHIHIARDHLVLTDPGQLMLTEAESRTLFDIARSLFEETGRQLLYANANTWFVRADEWADLQTSSPDTASGHNIDIWMPKGPGERDWRKVQNEVQMHWFNHAINEEREARRQKPVNSIWLWGGSTAAPGNVRPEYTHAFNLSGWLHAFVRFVPQHAHAGKAADMIDRKPERALLVLDALMQPALSNDWSRWLDNLHRLEELWFAPLLAALKSGTIAQANLILTNDTRVSRFTASKSSLRKFWVKPTLSPLAP